MFIVKEVEPIKSAGTGLAVLGVIELALPFLGPVPTIGALMGVAGAAGVSLSAAGALTDQYGEVVGRCGYVGVTVGATAGAFFNPLLAIVGCHRSSCIYLY